jgi:hypothetical protein
MIPDRGNQTNRIYCWTEIGRLTGRARSFLCCMGVVASPKSLQQNRNLTRHLFLKLGRNRYERLIRSDLAAQNGADAVDNVLHGEGRQQHAEEARQHDVPCDAEDSAESSSGEEGKETSRCDHRYDGNQ